MSLFRRQIPLLVSNHSDVGRVRETNEDYHLYCQIGSQRLFVVADGMGGASGGREASRTVVQAVHAVFQKGLGQTPRRLIARAMREANFACQSVKEERPELANMGATLDVVVVEENRAWWGHIGDGRIYHLHEDEATQVTRDHTLVQRMIDDGLITVEQAREHPKRHVLERVIGPASDIDPDICTMPIRLEEGDSLIMCTDGLYDAVSPKEMAWMSRQYGPQRACKRLVDLANQRGGHDNATVQIIHRGRPRGTWSRMRSQAPVPDFGPAGRRKLTWHWIPAAAALLLGIIVGSAYYLYSAHRPPSAAWSTGAFQTLNDVIRGPADTGDDFGGELRLILQDQAAGAPYMSIRFAPASPQTDLVALCGFYLPDPSDTASACLLRMRRYVGEEKGDLISLLSQCGQLHVDPSSSASGLPQGALGPGTHYLLLRVRSLGSELTMDQAPEPLRLDGNVLPTTGASVHVDLLPDGRIAAIASSGTGLVVFGVWARTVASSMRLEPVEWIARAKSDTLRQHLPDDIQGLSRRASDDSDVDANTPRARSAPADRVQQQGAVEPAAQPTAAAQAQPAALRAGQRTDAGKPATADIRKTGSAGQTRPTGQTKPAPRTRRGK